MALTAISLDRPAVLPRTANLALAAGLAAVFGLTALAGAVAAFDRPAAIARLVLIGLGLVLMLLLSWAGRRWGETVLGPVALACAALSAIIGCYFLLGAHWEIGGPAKLPVLQQLGASLERLRPSVVLPEDIHPNVAGALLAILIPLGAGGCAWAWQGRRRLLAAAGGLALLIGGVAFVLTVSRGAWLGMAAAIATGGLWWVTGRGAGRQGSPPRAVAALASAAVVLMLVLPALLALVDLPLADRLVGGVPLGGSVVSRTSVWRDALALIGDYPFTGSGLGSTAMVYSTYVLMIHAPYLYHVHSLLLQVAVEQGIIGAVLFAALMAAAMWQVMQPRKGQPHGLPLRVATAAALAALAVHGALDAGPYVSKGVVLLFLPVGMAFGLAKTPASPEPAPRRWAPWLGLGLALVAALLLLLPVQAAFQANLGALDQTRAELSAFHWPETPLQDVLRRPGGVDLRPAEARFQAALALDPNNVTSNRRLGQIALANEDFVTARRYLEAASGAAPGQRATRQMLGELAALSGDPAGAAASWRGIDFDGGAFQVREWWYGAYLGQPQAAEALRQAKVAPPEPKE